MRTTRLAAGLAALLVASTVLTLAQTPSAQTPQTPVFRTGVEVVSLDVLVLDRARRPVRGLTAADFTVRENGDVQPIVGFAEIYVPPPDMATAAWAREVASDAVSNDLANRRIVLILLDDFGIGVDFGEPRSVRRVAHAIIDNLGPNDLAAVVDTYLGRMENFTRDKTKLRASVENFTPQNWGRMGPPIGCQYRGLLGCRFDTFGRVAEILRTAPVGRKTVMFISPGIGLNNLREESVINPNLSDLGNVTRIIQNLQLGNTAVYSFDPRGLLTSGQTRATDQIDLETATGGRAIRDTNDPELEVPAIFQENSAYYLIGYRSTHTQQDGRFRRITVNVNRPDVEVRNRSGYYSERAAKASRPSTRPVPTALDTALARGMPTSGLAMSVVAAAFATPGKKTAEVAGFTTIREPAVDAAGGVRSARRVEVAAAAFDANWQSRGIQRQTVVVTLARATGGELEYEVASRLPLKPGRYEMRFAADVEGKTGSVYLTIDVPDFAKDVVSLSGIVLEKVPGLKTSVGQSVTDLMPIRPTAVRLFSRADTVTAFVRVYQGEGRPLSPIAVNTTIVDAHDRLVLNRAATLVADAFAATRSEGYQIAVPTGTLPAGDYLLRIEAAAPGRSAQQRVRFTVR